MNQEELTALLVNARRHKKLSQEQVVLLMNNIITRQYYGMIENGERRPSVEVAKSISKVLGINWTVFFEVKSNQKLLSEPKPA